MSGRVIVDAYMNAPTASRYWVPRISSIAASVCGPFGFDRRTLPATAGIMLVFVASARFAIVLAWTRWLSSSNRFFLLPVMWYPK